jgi:hypothetical protein
VSGLRFKQTAPTPVRPQVRMSIIVAVVAGLVFWAFSGDRNPTAIASPRASAASYQAFAILRRAAGPADAPTPAIETLARNNGGAYGLDVASTRKIALSGGLGSAWVVAGTTVVCLVVDSGGGVAAFDCNTTAAAETGALVLTTAANPAQASGPVTVVGVAPDAVRGVSIRTATGATIDPTIDSGVYSARIADRANLTVDMGPSSFSYAIAAP